MGLEETLASLDIHLRHSNVLMASLYRATQVKEADKTPHNERLFTVNVVCPILPNPQCWQIVPRNGSRKIISFVNQGPSDLLISNKWFDPVAILQQISDPANPDTVLPSPLQMVEIGIITKGGTLSMNTASNLFVYNVASTGSLISIQEDVFVVPNRTPTPPGSDGRNFQGYTELPDADANDGVQSVKALR